ncbi:MAG: ATP-NAD/AcoX kinase, partial [Bacteroidetes bacterium]|nr:ATP-NAD/AcoX kinase [Bacteroidota bacterium]
HRGDILAHIRLFSDFFKQKRVDMLLHRDLYDYAVSQGVLPQAEIIDNDEFMADFAISIGGDGTFLSTAAHIGSKAIPIVGINTGRLGFLADVPVENMLPAIEALLDNNYYLEERTLLAVETSDGTKFDYPFALNEVSVLKQDSSSMISINTHLNGEAIHTYQADGLLVSTPTGSTAYSMSVGGPLVVPQAQNFLLSPVASHSLNVRPLVVPDNWVIDLEVRSRSHCYQISLDGRTLILDQTTKLRITKADFVVKIVKQQNQTFFDTLKKKLMWGMDKRN